MSAAPARSDSPRLDLQWAQSKGPAMQPAATSMANTAQLRPFRERPAIDLKGPDYREWLPELGRDAAPVEPSRIEAVARRLHHEGLPLARLWQNESALLSLGLNPRGKPGLWLIQKLH